MFDGALARSQRDDAPGDYQTAAIHVVFLQIFQKDGLIRKGIGGIAVKIVEAE